MKTPHPPHFETDPDAPATEEELRLAGELRDALADPSRDHDDAALARALVLAHAPRPIDADEHEALLHRALLPRDAELISLVAARARRARVARWSLGLGAVAAAAAFLVLRPSGSAPVASAQREPPPTLHARSSQPLFREPFAAHGGTSARIDRIASARASDLRENRFARWDVR